MGGGFCDAAQGTVTAVAFSVPVQIDDVIDEIISLESSYDELLSFGPAEGALQLPNTVRCPFKGVGGGDCRKQRPFALGGGGACGSPALPASLAVTMGGCGLGRGQLEGVACHSPTHRSQGGRGFQPIGGRMLGHCYHIRANMVLGGWGLRGGRGLGACSCGLPLPVWSREGGTCSRGCGQTGWGLGVDGCG